MEHVETGAAAGAAHQSSERPDVHTLDDSSEREWVNFVVDAGSQHVVAVDGADVAAAERRGDDVETGNDSLTPGLGCDVALAPERVGKRSDGAS